MSRLGDTAYRATIAAAIIGLAGTVFQAVWPDLAQTVRIHLGIQRGITLLPAELSMETDHKSLEVAVKQISLADIHFLDPTRLGQFRIWYAVSVGPEGRGGIGSLKYQVVSGPYQLRDVGTPVKLRITSEMEKGYWCDLYDATLLIVAAPTSDELEAGFVPDHLSDLIVFGSGSASEERPDQQFCH